MRVLTRPYSTTSLISGVYGGSPRGSVLLPGFSGSGELCYGGYEDEVCLERVESGRDLRAEIYAKLSNENLSLYGRSGSHVSAPDFEWISELVK